MTEKTQLFQFAGERPAEKTEAEKKKKWYQDRPVAAELFLGLLVLGCLFCRQIMTKDPHRSDNDQKGTHRPSAPSIFPPFSVPSPL